MKYCTRCYVLYTKKDPAVEFIGFGTGNETMQYHEKCTFIGSVGTEYRDG